MFKHLYISRLFFTLMVFALYTTVNGQQIIRGKVANTQAEPLIGATIVEKSSAKGTVTDFEGSFELEVAALPTVLSVSYVGYTTTEITVSSAEALSITLAESALGLDEVTVTALGIAREKKALGYAVQELGGEEIAAANGANLVSSLAGRTAGVQVVSSGAGAGASASVVIRGYTSMSGDNQPLFVVDGTPINNTTDTRTNTRGIASNMNMDFGNGAADINPDDIESISVLKGANATALYGSRAANGAVIITTKSGKGKKGIGVSVHSKTTFESVLAGPEYQREYGQGKNFQFGFVDGYGNGTFDGVDESWGPRLDGRLLPQHDSPTANGLRGGDVHGLDFVLGPSGVNLARRGAITPTPFVDPGDPIADFMETGRTLINNVSFFGNNDKGNFRVSYTNFDNTGILPNTDLRRNTVAISGDYSLTDKLTVSAKSNYIRTDSDNRHVNGYGTESVMYLFIWWGQNVGVGSLRDYWQRGLEGFQQFNYNYNYHDNPYFTMYENTNSLQKDRIIGNISATYKFTPYLNLMVRGGTDFFSEYRFMKRAYSTQRFPRGQYREDKINFNETNLDFLLNFNKDFGSNLSISANLGGNRMIQKNHFNGLSANGLLIPGVYSFTNTSVPLVQSIDRPERQINSLYGFAQIGWKNAIYLDLTARNDWSSTLPVDNNSYFYPSASLSAVLTDLFDVPVNSVLSFAKLRVGVAQVGSDASPFQLANPFLFGGTPFGSNATAAPSNALPNLDLKPELQTSYEIGADVRLFKNKLNLDLTYYNTISENQIIGIELPATTGKTSRLINAGKIRNYGIEALVGVAPLSSDKKFQWNALFNFSLNRNEILELPEGVDQYVYGGNRVTLVAQKGGSLGDMWGTGLKTVQDPSSPYYGEVIFKNGLVQEDNTLRKIGNFNPDFMLGVTNEFSYKNFSLSFLVDYRQGGDLISATRLIAATSGNVVETLWGREPEFGGPHPGIFDSGLSYTDGSGQTKTDGIIGAGVKEVVNDNGSITYAPNDVRVPANAYHNNRYRRQNETEGLYDATFIKLREARLSYQIPASVLNSKTINKLTLSLIGNNLMLWAKDFNHGDPELLSFGGGQFVPGVEDATVPSSRSVGFSVKVDF